jgi:uncharacterized protein YjeT (DUF2065 family)
MEALPVLQAHEAELVAARAARNVVAGLAQLDPVLAERALLRSLGRAVLWFPRWRGRGGALMSRLPRSLAPSTCRRAAPAAGKRSDGLLRIDVGGVVVLDLGAVRIRTVHAQRMGSLVLQ